MSFSSGTVLESKDSFLHAHPHHSLVQTESEKEGVEVVVVEAVYRQYTNMNTSDTLALLARFKENYDYVMVDLRDKR